MLWYVYAAIDHTTGLCEIGYCRVLERRVAMYERAYGWPVGTRHDVKLLAMSRTRSGAQNAYAWCIMAWRTYEPFGHNKMPHPEALARARELSPKALKRTPRGGYKASEAHRAKISRALKGRASPLKGRPRPDEVRAKISATHKGRARPKLGRPLTPEHRAKIAAALRGKRHTLAAREKMSLARRAPGRRQGCVVISEPDGKHVHPVQL